MFFPGMEQFYGPNLTVNIEYIAEKIDQFHSVENDDTMSFQADMSVNFWVVEKNGTQSDAVKIFLSDFYFNFTIEIVDMIAKANVTDVSLKTITVNSTTFSNVSGKSVALLLNEGLKLGIPFFNIYLEKLKFTIPSTLFNNLFKLSDPTIKYFSNYIEVGLTPTFVPPKVGSDWLPEQVPWPWGDKCDGKSATTSIDENDQVSFTQCPEHFI